MKKLVCLLLVLVLALSIFAGCGGTKNQKLAAIKKQGYMTLAISPDFGPYEFMDLTKSGTDAVVGCEVELAKYIADYIGVELKIEPMEFSECQAAVTLGKVDFSISGFALTDDRKDSMGYSDYYTWQENENSNQGVIILKKDAAKYTTAESFKGKKLAVQNASLQYNLVTDQLPETEYEIIASLNDGIMMLLNGKVDGIASSYDTGEQFCKNYDELVMSDYLFDYTEEGTVVLTGKGEDDLIAEINKALKKAKEENKFIGWLNDAKALCDELGVQVN